MPKTIPYLQESKKPFHKRNGSGELHVFEATRYYEGNTALAYKQHTREGVGRLSLDIPNSRRNSISLQAMMIENQNSIPLQNMMVDTNPRMIKNQKKYKQPSSPGGKLAHFLNSLFNQTSSKKSKSKSLTSLQSMKYEDESPSGWRRKRSSISLFRNRNSNTTIVSDSKSCYSKTPPPYHIPQAPTKTTSHSHHKPTCEITKIPFNENLKVKSVLSEKKKSYGHGLLEKIRVCDAKHDDRRQKNDPTVEIKELKRFILDDDDDDGGHSDSSSDLFELTNFDLGYYSSGLPVFETTHIDSIKRGGTNI